jgi:hypothetical protein
MADENDYPFIRKWGQLLGSHDYYIEDQIEEARLDGAPAKAIYRDRNGVWHTTDEISKPEIRRQMGLEPL